MSGFDTSGEVVGLSAGGIRIAKRWTDLNPFTQGYVEALEQFVGEYVDLVNSGDAGFWDPETEPKVIAARAALSHAHPPSNHTEESKP